MKQIKSEMTETALHYYFPIYTVTSKKISHWELIKGIYSYTRKQFRKNHGKKVDPSLTISLYHSEPPYRMIATWMDDEKIIWSTDPVDQEETRKYLDWQEVEQYYIELKEKCDLVIALNKIEEARIAAAKEKVSNIGKITIKNPNIKLIQYRKSMKIKENYLQSNKIRFDRSIYWSTEHNNDDWSMFSELYEKMGGVTYSKPKKYYANDYDWSDYYGFDDDDYFEDWEDDDQQEDSVQYIKNELDLTVDYLNYPYRMTLHHSWKRSESIVLWSQDETEQNAVKKDFSYWKAIEAFYNDYFERRNKYIEKNVVGVANFFATEERKEKTREQRKNNDPTNPEARKRRARRHLQRLGYDLRVSRQRYTKEKYQIVKLDGGEVVMGTNSLDDIERFYIEADYIKMTSTWEYYPAALYNKEPQLEKREAAATKALKKMGYKLIRTKYYDGIYNRAIYHIMRKKEKIWIDREDEFTLAEVEQFILSNS